MHRLAIATLTALSVASATHAATKDDAPAEGVAWVECLQTYADRHVASDVSVETIATAAMGYCRDHDRDVLASRMKRPMALRFVLGPLTRAERDEVREDHEGMREEFKERLIGDLIERRSGLPASPRS